jgi:hypothetical protein
MRKTVLVLVGCLALSAAPVWADGAFHLFGSYGEVNQYTRGFGFGARGSFGGDHVWVDLTATWFPSRSGTLFKYDSNPVRDQIEIIPIDLGLRWIFGSDPSLRPYIGAGATYMMVNLSSGDADDEVGFYGMAGLIFQTGARTGLYAEAIYRVVDTPFTYEGVEYDEKFGGFAGTFGILWTF